MIAGAEGLACKGCFKQTFDMRLRPLANDRYVAYLFFEDGILRDSNADVAQSNSNQ